MPVGRTGGRSVGRMVGLVFPLKVQKSGSECVRSILIAAWLYLLGGSVPGKKSVIEQKKHSSYSWRKKTRRSDGTTTGQERGQGRKKEEKEEASGRKEAMAGCDAIPVDVEQRQMDLPAQELIRTSGRQLR